MFIIVNAQAGLKFDTRNHVTMRHARKPCNHATQKLEACSTFPATRKELANHERMRGLKNRGYKTCGESTVCLYVLCMCRYIYGADKWVGHLWAELENMQLQVTTACIKR